ncbi:MAG: PDZ domain-containing protein, partial [Candidatus Dadabacteria bacterium]|nr:PDZ domain-containing protein [Candidatus Dadabacteria bacterium]NIQ13515.1 PDZ domain-containing protein [Candidatus Dadabacteria bacterium]
MKAINKLFNSSYLTLLLISFLTLSFFFIAKPVHLQQNDDIELEFIETVLKYVNKFYVDKEKIDYKRILIDGINKLEIELDEVLVDFPDSEVANKFTVQVNNNRKEYTNINVGTTDNLLNVYRDVFSFVFSNLNNNEIDIRDIEYAVSDKILKTLDPHSAIITPDVYKEFLIETEGSFGGLGIVIGIRDGQLTVISPIEGTPAYKAGIKPNDKIVQIESESTINMTLIEAVGKLRGEKGSEVNIHVMRENFNKPKKFSI